jgi:hypothetical protein
MSESGQASNPLHMSFWQGKSGRKSAKRKTVKRFLYAGLFS